MASTSPGHDVPAPAERWTLSAASFQRWQAGSAEGLDTLVGLMTPVLWHVVRAYHLDESSTEDVLQFTWMTLLRRHESIENPQAVASWLMITARRQAWRVAQRNHRDEPRDEDTLAPHLPAAVSAEEGAVQGQEREALWSAVHTLPERCQRLLRVIAFDDRPNYKALAEDLGLAIGSIGATRRRCLDSLHQALGKRD